MSQWALPIIASLTAPFFAFLAIAWKLSGRIATSEARDLWEEARSLREDYRKRIEQCEEYNSRLTAELHNCLDRNVSLHREFRELRDSRKGD